MPLAPLPPKIEFVLGHRLERVAYQLRAIAFHRAGLAIWATVATIAAALATLQLRSPTWAAYAAPALLAVFVVGCAGAIALAWRDRTNVVTAARYLAKHHPALRSALLAAVEQRPEANGNFHFLQRRVIDDALRHSETKDWLARPRREARWLLAAHILALIAALAFSAVVLREHRVAPHRNMPIVVNGLEVTPGDAEIERGSTVVVAARFNANALPSQATLVWQPANGSAQRTAMQRSLSDPVFAFTLPPLTTDLTYRVEHDRGRSQAFTLKVFDRPALVRADASLDYPEYTGLADRRIVDTRRVSAVVGTKLDYDFIVNKPLARALLRQSGQPDVALTAVPNDPTRFRWSTVLSESKRYSLILEDPAGRTNGAPVEVRVEALENRRPEFKLTFPRGDQQVSPLEEMHLEADVRDDFGLRDFGFGLSIADAAPQYLSLAPAGAGPTVQATLKHLLSLETTGVKPDQLVSWFAWADDIGPDAQVRRSTSDVFFAQVRSLEEVFREDANGGAPPAGSPAGGPGDELVETQRQISIAIWKLRQQDAGTASFVNDATTLRDSQRQAAEQLKALRERLEDARARTAADQAAPLMKQAEDALTEAANKHSAATLDQAWTAARGAYQALLRTQPRDTRVSQSRNPSRSRSGGRSQQQLNELDFRQENDRYETETQAQPPPTPEQREQLSVLARLRELARRQQDLNARLQELQTALAAAEDDAKREALRRELKRLEEEQRQMMSEVDEARQRVDRMQPGEQTQQARQQLDRTREDMRRASEQLQQGEVSQALAAGGRARENLQKTSEGLRQEAAGRLGEEMREARRQARELSAQQQEANQALEKMNRGQQSLDDSQQRESIAQQLQQQAERREALMETLRQVTEESEGSEPKLHRQLYDLLRQQGQSGVENELKASAELLRRGFIDPARERQAGVAREFEKLQQAVERAAGSVLGDETNELRFAQRELEDLSRELQRDRRDGGDQTSAPSAGNESSEGQPAQANGAQPSESLANGAGAEGREAPASGGEQQPASSRPGNSTAESRTAGNQPGEKSGSPGAAGDAAGLEQLARELGGRNQNGSTTRGPLTGGGFADWADRLRTVEDLMEAPDLRQRLAGARNRAEELRRANQRDGKAPQWDLVEMGVVAPLQDARAWLRQELNRREQPDALQPIDRDPVPERFAESVRSYYEALGSDQPATSP